MGYRNSTAPTQPRSSTCTNSSCWYLIQKSALLSLYRAVDILFAARVKVDPRHGAIALVEADVVEALETSSSNGLDLVIWDQEVFFPSHKQMLALCVVLACEIGRFGVLSKRFPGRETGPVLHVDLFCRAPFWMRSAERVFGTNDFAFEIRGQRRMVVGKPWARSARISKVCDCTLTLNAQVSANK